MKFNHAKTTFYAKKENARTKLGSTARSRRKTRMVPVNSGKLRETASNTENQS